jgi:hypothetical protein
MHRRRSVVSVAVGLAAAAVLGSGCGVVADTTAATVGGRVVDVAQVDALAADEEFLEFGLGLAGAAPATDSRIPGETARAVLLFEIQRAAWFAELDRWGLEIDDEARRAGEARLDQEIDLAGVRTTFSDDVREVFIDYFAAQELLTERFSRLDAEDEGDLRRLYEGGSVLWERTCVEVAEFDAADEEQVRALLEDGADPAAVAEAIPTAELVADPARSCVSTSQIQVDLRAAIDAAPEGVVSDVVLLDAGGTQVGYVFRVTGRERLALDDAREDLVQIITTLVQQGPANWVGLLVATAEVDPRYGSGISTGPGGVPTVDPPPTPLQPPAPVLELPEGIDLPQDDLPVAEG